MNLIQYKIKALLDIYLLGLLCFYGKIKSSLFLQQRTDIFSWSVICVGIIVKNILSSFSTKLHIDEKLSKEAKYHAMHWNE